MPDILRILVAILMAGTLIVLLLGLVNLGRGGEGSERRSNRLMMLRVGLQAAAVMLLGVLFYFGKK